MTGAAATRCCGVALCAALLLPAFDSHAAPSGQAVPPPPPFEPVWTEPVEPGDPVDLLATAAPLIVSGRGRPTTALSATDGAVTWTYVESPHPLASGDGLAFVLVDHQVHALELVSGALHWVADIGAPVAGPVWLPGLVLVLAGDQAVALRSRDGTLAWSRALPGPLGRPVVSENRLVVAVETSRLELVALSADTGADLWRVPLHDRPGPMLAAHGSVLFGASSGTCYGYRLRDGRMDWAFATRVATVGAPAADAQRAYFALFNNTVTAFDRQVGNLRWTRMLDDRPAAGLTMLDGDLLVAGSHGDLLSLPSEERGAMRRLDPSFETVAGTALEALAVSADARRIYRLTSSPDEPGFTLTALRHVDPAR